MFACSRAIGIKTAVVAGVFASSQALGGDRAPPPPVKVLATIGQARPIENTQNFDFMSSRLAAAENGWVTAIVTDVLLQTEEETISRSRLIVSSGGKFTTLATDGDLLPDGVATFAALRPFLDLVINSRGEVLFPATLDLGPPEVTPENAFGWWLADSAGIRLVLRQGAPLSGGGTIPDLRFQGSLNDAGDVAIGAPFEAMPGMPQLIPPAAAWRVRQQETAQVVTDGDVAPGTLGATFLSIGTPPIFGEDSQIVFLAQLNLNGDNADGRRGRGIWEYGLDSNRLVVRSGDVAPGFDGRKFGFFASITVNQEGSIAFRVVSEDFTSSGIFVASEKEIVPVVLAGQEAPGAGGQVFGSAGSDLIFTDTGRVVFSAIIQDAAIDANTGYWVSDPGGVQALAIEGEGVPGVPGARFFMNLQRQVAANAAGDVVFKGQFRDPATGEQVNAIFWWEPQERQTRLVLRPGDTIDIDNDPLRQDLRVVAGTGFAEASTVVERRATGLADDRFFYTTVSFDDGTGALVRYDLTGGCIADIDQDGAVDSQDIRVFTKAVRGGLLSADLDGDGSVDVQDINAFVSAFLAGCS